MLGVTPEHQVVLQEYRTDISFKWIFTPDNFIQLYGTDLVLDIEGGGGSGSPVNIAIQQKILSSLFCLLQLIVYQRKAKDNSNQKWKYNEANQEIDSFVANLVVDAKAEGVEPGTPVIAYGAKAPVAANQQWYTLYSLLRLFCF